MAERGIRENTNGLLRQYVRKGTGLSVFSLDQLGDIAWRRIRFLPALVS
jgi:IS30 family transposase